MRMLWRTAVWAFAFVIALFFLLRQGPEQDVLYLWKIAFADIQAIELVGPGISYGLHLANGQWQFESDTEEWEADPVAVQSWLKPLLHPHAKSMLGGTKTAVSHYETYGLNPAQATLTIKLSQGADQHLLIGYGTALKGNTYVQVAGEDAVYLFSLYKLSAYLSNQWEHLKKSPASAEPATLPAGP